MAAGGIGTNRKLFGTLFAGVDHLPSTYDRAKQAFTKGEPEWGAQGADELERIVGVHDASTIAAVIVEPMAGRLDWRFAAPHRLSGTAKIDLRQI
jgi:beta-alanine--pyruvate transaminase